MSENEDPIHVFFKKAADRYSIDFNEKDWSNMEMRLRENARQQRIMRWRRYGAALTGALLIGAVIFYWRTAGPERLAVADQAVHERGSLHDSNGSPSQSNEVAVDTGIYATHDAMKRQSVAPRQTLKVKEKESLRRSLAPGLPVIQAIDSTKKQSAARNTTEITGNSNEFKAPDEFKANEFNTVAGDSLAPADSIGLAGSIKKNRHRQWSLAAVFAPDFSSIDGKQYAKAGQSTGIIFLYHISDRFSVGAGVLGGRKVYNARGDLYNTPEGYWTAYTNGNVPRQINGSCTVIELPLMVRYQKNFPRGNWHIVAGVSSYLMFDESYQYLFEPGAQVNDVNYRNPSRRSNYPFNVGSASFGYERSVLPNLFVGIEPYIKIPFAGMGWPDVKLFSGGAYLTLRYQVGGKMTTAATALSKHNKYHVKF